MLEAAKELDYKPNLIARGLVQRRTWQIGLIVPSQQHPLMSLIIEGLHISAQELGYSIISCATGGNKEREAKYFNDLQTRDSMDLSPAASQPRNLEVAKQLVKKVPTIQGFRKLAELDAPYVILDNVRGGYKATKHLIDLGHKRIAHFHAGGGEEAQERLPGVQAGSGRGQVACREKANYTNRIRLVFRIQSSSYHAQGRPPFRFQSGNSLLCLRRHDSLGCNSGVQIFGFKGTRRCGGGRLRWTAVQR